MGQEMSAAQQLVPYCPECEQPAGGVHKRACTRAIAFVDMVNHPPHYNAHPSEIECIEITRHLTFDVGNAFKHVYRCEVKNGREDLEKRSGISMTRSDTPTRSCWPRT